MPCRNSFRETNLANNLDRLKREMLIRAPESTSPWCRGTNNGSKSLLMTNRLYVSREFVFSSSERESAKDDYSNRSQMSLS